MTDDIKAALTAVIDRLGQLANEEPSFRANLVMLLDAIQVAVKPPEMTPHQAAPAPEASPPAVAPPLEPEAAPTALAPAIVFQAPAKVAAPPPAAVRRTTAPLAEIDLERVEARCHLKAEAAHWAAKRRRLMAAGASFRGDIDPKDTEMIERGKRTDCFLWMCSPYAPSSNEPHQYDLIAGCFDASAQAVSLVRLVLEVDDEPERPMEVPLHLLAEAQSGLRIAVAALDGHVDEDQEQIFQWLKNATSEMQIYVRRHMKLDDPANPSGAANLIDRIQAVRSTVEQTRKWKSQRKKLLGKIRHKLSLLPAASDSERLDLWQGVTAAVDQLVSWGLPPSNKHLRELLLPALDGLPKLPDLPNGFQLFLREIDRYREVTRSLDIPAPEQRVSADVQRVAELLAGHSVVFIGGDSRPEPKKAMEEAFGLRELVWVATRDHEPTSIFQAIIARPEVALVLLAIRWSSHSYTEIQQYCDAYGKPLVRLPGGYNVNQVATQILMQASDRLSNR